MIKAVAERRAARVRMLETAADYARRLSDTLELRAAVVYGSVARGDFNRWSDVDLLVLADDLPARTPDRGALLAERAPAGIQPVGMTPAELELALRRRNRIAIEAVEHGVTVYGSLPPADDPAAP